MWRWREAGEGVMLRYPGARAVGLQKDEKDRWEIIVYFEDKDSMEDAFIAPRSLGGIPVRKVVADAGTVRKIIDRIGS